MKAPFQRLVRGVADSFQALEFNYSELLKMGQAAINSEEELSFATASEPTGPKPAVGKSRKKTKAAVSSSEESSEEEEEQLALALRKSKAVVPKKKRKKSPAPRRTKTIADPRGFH